MIDLLGVATIGDQALRPKPNLDLAFSLDPWANSKLECVRIDDVGYSVVGMRRPGDPQDFAESTDYLLLVVGEVFGRPGRLGNGKGRISARALLTAFAAHGTSLVDAIKGNFTILVLDKTSKKFTIIPSHFAVSPLYFANVAGDVYFSTSLGYLGRLMPAHPGYDLAGIVETVILNWPLHDRTFLKGVKRTTPGTIVCIGPDGVSRETYWDQRPLYHGDLISIQDGMEGGSELFHQCVNSMISDYPRICASFTSGFDSRALHAVFEKDRSRILSYSFGIPGSINVSIPQTICDRNRFPFRALYLGREYEDVFQRYARRTILLSDGQVVQRANYPYAFERLSAFAPVVVTGIFGSEFLRTFQNLGVMVNQNFLRMNEAPDPVGEARRIIDDVGLRSYLAPDVFSSCREEVEADIDAWFTWAHGFNTKHRVHLYLLGESCLKYFGAEVNTERVYAANLFPYLDIDFIEFIFRAPFIGVHSQSMKPSIADRFVSQQFYAHLIRKYRPELLSYTTDHGYPPSDLLKPMPALHAVPKKAWSVAKTRFTRYREFTPQEWLSPFYRDSLFANGAAAPSIIAPRFRQDFENGTWHTDLTEFDKIAALCLWMEEWQ